MTTQYIICLDSMLVLLRRFLIVDVGDGDMQVAAVLLTAIEEVLFRSTMVARDVWLRRVMGKDELDAEAMAWQRLMWATSINQSVVRHPTLHASTGKGA